MPSSLFSKWRRNRTSYLLVVLGTMLFCVLWTLGSVPITRPIAQPITFSQCAHTGDVIPRRLHQMWKNRTIPNRWRESQHACRIKNDNYEYFLWTDAEMERFITQHYAWFLPTYHSYPYPIQRVDAVRYFILYHYGGVYVDLDLQCKFSFDAVLANISRTSRNYRVVLAQTLPGGVTNAVMMTHPCSPFFRQLVTSLPDSNHGYVLPYATVIFSTGPMFLTLRLNHYASRNEIYTFSNHEFRHVYFEHKLGSSWHSWDGRIIHVLDHWSDIACVILVPFIIMAIVVFVMWRRRRYQHCNEHLKTEL
ncbi:Inositol phosphoceramide mannosyltransferase 3 [Lamellibrachia satsuma]|nr:Inositol phosphoceramide mannosyltransferase 3 [Lamellibrachia satsuma]